MSDVEEALSDAVNTTMMTQPDDPIAFLAEILRLSGSGSAMAASPSAGPRFKSRRKKTVTTGCSEDKDRPNTEWTCASWLDSMKATSAISGALLDAVTSDAGTELDMVRSLCDASEAELAARLRDGEIVERVVQLLHPELQKLRTMQAATGAELHSKFAHEVAESGKGFTLKYADLSTFYGGLEAKIGTPSPNFAPAMANEHTKSADSQDSFSTSNYGVTTTPEIEWFFVTDADTLAELPPTERDRRCPKETTNVKDEARRRQPMRLQHLRWKVAEKNTQLAKAHEPVLMLEEAFAGRLYTGPMFVKYNDLLRGFGPALEGCLGNTYVTTTHAINSCIFKIGKLTAACKVYRGVSGGVLPDSFLVPNHFNVRGGIESAFMSTTKDPEVAKHYLRPGAPATIFEMQMGMGARAGSKPAPLSSFEP